MYMFLLCIMCIQFIPEIYFLVLALQNTHTEADLENTFEQRETKYKN